MRSLLSKEPPLNDNKNKGPLSDIAAADDMRLENSDKNSTGAANPT